MRTPHPNNTSRLANELAIHAIQKKIKERVEFQTNYANVFTQIRYLISQLDFYDRPSNPGFISADDFMHYFTRRMNFMSLEAEIEYLFYHYDDGMSGYINYKDFIEQLYQATDFYLPILTVEAVNTIEQIRSAFISPHRNEQHDFLKFLIRLKDRIRYDAEGFSLRTSVVDQLFGIIVTAGKSSAPVISKKDLSDLLKFFDFQKEGTVHVPTFFRYLKSVMSPFRKRLLRAVYKMLDRDGQGYATVGDIKACYHILPSRTITIRGKTFHRATLEELLQYIFNNNDISRLSNSRGVSWDAFSEYYQCISLAIDSEELFELVIRHSWSIPDGFLEGKPMANDIEPIFTREQSLQSLFSEKMPSSSSLQRDLSASFDTTTTEEARVLSPCATASKSTDLVPESSSTDIIITTSASMDVESTEFASNSFDLQSPTSKKPPRHPISSSSKSPRVKRPVSRAIGVIHSNYTEETVLIEELGGARLDVDAIQKELTARGILDIKYLRL